MTRKIIAVALVAAAFAVSACNTVSGAGDDLKSASQETKDAINK
ncbi:entericidin EcnA/B family protein [Sphingomonas flavalba]|nr:entericidin EcnA/B family protein [Sphingomonas flavalba]